MLEFSNMNMRSLRKEDWCYMKVEILRVLQILLEIKNTYERGKPVAEVLNIQFLCHKITIKCHKSQERNNGNIKQYKSCKLLT